MNLSQEGVCNGKSPSASVRRHSSVGFPGGQMRPGAQPCPMGGAGALSRGGFTMSYPRCSAMLETGVRGHGDSDRNQ